MVRIDGQNRAQQGKCLIFTTTPAVDVCQANIGVLADLALQQRLILLPCFLQLTGPCQAVGDDQSQPIVRCFPGQQGHALCTHGLVVLGVIHIVEMMLRQATRGGSGWSFWRSKGLNLCLWLFGALLLLASRHDLPRDRRFCRCWSWRWWDTCSRAQSIQAQCCTGGVGCAFQRLKLDPRVVKFAAALQAVCDHKSQ